MSEAPCKTCGNTIGWHSEHPQVRHVFNDGSVPFKTTFGARTPRDDRKTAQQASEATARPAWPFDPVLRQALIDKGVLTPEDLISAEQKILTITGQFRDTAMQPGQEGNN
jgi:hypothetical protein